MFAPDLPEDPAAQARFLDQHDGTGPATHRFVGDGGAHDTATNDHNIRCFPHEFGGPSMIDPIPRTNAIGWILIGPLPESIGESPNGNLGQRSAAENELRHPLSLHACRHPIDRRGDGHISAWHRRGPSARASGRNRFWRRALAFVAGVQAAAGRSMPLRKRRASFPRPNHTTGRRWRGFRNRWNRRGNRRSAHWALGAHYRWVILTSSCIISTRQRRPRLRHNLVPACYWELAHRVQQREARPSIPASVRTFRI